MYACRYRKTYNDKGFTVSSSPTENNSKAEGAAGGTARSRPASHRARSARHSGRRRSCCCRGRASPRCRFRRGVHRHRCGPRPLPAGIPNVMRFQISWTLTCKPCPITVCPRAQEVAEPPAMCGPASASHRPAWSPTRCSPCEGKKAESWHRGVCYTYDMLILVCL